MVSKLFKEFVDSEKAGGITLIVCTLFSLLCANSIIGQNYISIWHYSFYNHPIEYWINDGLMTFFFLLIGLELEREIYIGELSNIKKALFPILAAIGGMIFPASIYLALNYGTFTQSGAGIPMATDIAFALGILSLLGKRIPISLKIFLTALAVIDDLGAILIIALFYTKTILWTNLLIALGIFVFLFLLNRLKIQNLIPYLIGGVAMWFFMLNSGVHATITGVLLAFVIPFGNGNKSSSSYLLQHSLHKPVAFILLPLFALANTAIILNSNWIDYINQKYTIGIALGLIIGKPIGIWLFSFLSVKLKLCQLPENTNWKSIFGVSILGGIGFTMSIFIALLALPNSTYIDNAKIIILISSFLMGIIGIIFLKNIKWKTYR